MPKDVVNGSPEDFNNFVSVEEGTLTVKYEPDQVINFCIMKSTQKLKVSS